MLIVYVLFCRTAIYTSKRVPDAIYKQRFKLLFIYDPFAVLVLFIMFLNRVVILVTNGAITYTPFYYAGWACLLVALICTYMGYFRTIEDTASKEEKSPHSR
jgi:hypothetical protein